MESRVFSRRFEIDAMSDKDWEEHARIWMESLRHQEEGEDEVIDCEDDLVNHPPHYWVFPDEEAINLIESCLSYEELQGYLKGNYLKYKLRAGQKDNLEQDIAKAEWYQNRLFEVTEYI